MAELQALIKKKNVVEDDDVFVTRSGAKIDAHSRKAMHSFIDHFLEVASDSPFAFLFKPDPRKAKRRVGNASEQISWWKTMKQRMRDSVSNEQGGSLAPVYEMITGSQMSAALMAFIPIHFSKVFQTGNYAVDVFATTLLVTFLVALIKLIGSMVYWFLEEGEDPNKYALASLKIDYYRVDRWGERTVNIHHQAMSWLISEHAKAQKRGDFRLVPYEPEYYAEDDEYENLLPLFNILPRTSDMLEIENADGVMYSVYFMLEDEKKPSDQNAQPNNLANQFAGFAEIERRSSSNQVKPEPPIVICRNDGDDFDLEWMSNLIDTVSKAYIKNQQQHKLRARYERSYSWWSRVLTFPKGLTRTIESVALDKTQELLLHRDLTTFHNDKEFYNRLGIPYKRGYLFTGPPGTGKTSLINAISATYERDLYYINLREIEDDTALQSAFNSVPKNCIIVLEDVDAQSAVVHSRERKNEFRKRIEMAEQARRRAILEKKKREKDVKREKKEKKKKLMKEKKLEKKKRKLEIKKKKKELEKKKEAKKKALEEAGETVEEGDEELLQDAEDLIEDTASEVSEVSDDPEDESDSDKEKDSDSVITLGDFLAPGPDLNDMGPEIGPALPSRGTGTGGGGSGGFGMFGFGFGGGDMKGGRGADLFGRITLSALLNCLDGDMLAEGTIIIMTSNHPEVLDPALIRPGRIDLRLDLGHATHYQMASMYRTVMNIQRPESSKLVYESETIKKAHAAAAAAAQKLLAEHTASAVLDMKKGGAKKKQLVEIDSANGDETVVEDSSVGTPVPSDEELIEMFKDVPERVIAPCDVMRVMVLNRSTAAPTDEIPRALVERAREIRNRTM